MCAFEELKQKVITHIAEIERVAYIQAQYHEKSNTYQSCESRITQQKLLIEAALDEYEAVKSKLEVRDYGSNSEGQNSAGTV